jgi:hypothetical protein
MVDIADILPSTETVSVRGNDVEVVGLELGDLIKLGKQYPELAKLVEGFKIEALLDLPREVQGAILAAGIGKLGDEGTARGLGNLKLGERAGLAAAIVRQTGGLIPFAELMAAVAGVTKTEDEPDNKIPPGGVKVRLAKRSQPQPNGSGEPDTQSATSLQ